MNFTTTGSSGNGGGTTVITCATPISLTNSNVTAYTARISWAAVPGATTYTVQLRLANATTYFTLGTITSNAGNITGFTPNTAYVWRVKANCSEYSQPKTLVTLSGQTNSHTFSNELPTITLSENSELSVYPNPANSVLHLQIGTALTPDTEVWITSATGQLISRRRWTAEETPIDISTLTTGLYFLTIVQEGQRMATEKFVKEM